MEDGHTRHQPREVAGSAVLAGSPSRRADAAREDRGPAAASVAAELVDRHCLPVFRQAPAFYLFAFRARIQVRAVAAVLPDVRREVAYRLHLVHSFEEF